MKLRSLMEHLAGQVFGFALAVLGIALLLAEYADGPSHAHTSHIFAYIAIFGVGCLIVAPVLITGAATKLVMIIVDARKGGLRWSDPPPDSPPVAPKPSVIEKPPEGAGDV